MGTALPESKATASAQQNLETAQSEGADMATQLAKILASVKALQQQMLQNQQQQQDLSTAYTKAVTADAETKKEAVEKEAAAVDREVKSIDKKIDSDKALSDARLRPSKKRQNA